MVINQGDIYWVDLGEPIGSAPGYLHSHVIIQNNAFNQSRIGTVVVCALTSNLKRASAPGNVLLELGEANLPKQSFDFESGGTGRFIDGIYDCTALRLTACFTPAPKTVIPSRVPMLSSMDGAITTGFDADRYHRN